MQEFSFQVSLQEILYWSHPPYPPPPPILFSINTATYKNAHRTCSKLTEWRKK